jgi:hypothetical protein
MTEVVNWSRKRERLERIRDWLEAEEAAGRWEWARIQRELPDLPMSRSTREREG